METIKSVPVYQCNNGHVICKECIKELNNCPICRNDSAPARSLQLEKLVHRLEGIQPENEGPATGTPNLQKWGMGPVRSYGTINGPNQAAPIEINLHANPRHQDVGAAMPEEQAEISGGLFACMSLGCVILFWGFVWACLYIAIWLNQ